MSASRQPSSAALLIGLARAIPAIGLAILFGWMAFFVRGNGGREIDWFGPAFFAVLAGAGAVWIIVRALGKSGGPAPKQGGTPDPAGEPSFDPDAALQRYLAGREIGASPDPDPPKPPPRGFGRKGV